MKTLKNISFIDTKLSQTIKSEHKASLIKMLSDQQKSLMISSSDMPYAVEAFNEKPFISDYPISPKSKLVIILNATLSIILSIFIIIIKAFFEFKRNDQ